MSKSRSLERPPVSELKEELKRERYRSKYGRILRNTVFTLIVVAAVTVLAATLLFPVMRIFGSSMTPTLQEGEIVVAIKSSSFQAGDIIGFYYGNKLIVKRCIAGPGDWVNITEDGTVYINGEELDEPYLVEKALGDCDIELPIQVPEDQYFVMGDHRSTSVDSRNTVIGCIAKEQIVGRIALCVWPLPKFGKLN